MCFAALGETADLTGVTHPSLSDSQLEHGNGCQERLIREFSLGRLPQCLLAFPSGVARMLKWPTPVMASTYRTGNAQSRSVRASALGRVDNPVVRVPTQERDQRAWKWLKGRGDQVESAAHSKTPSDRAHIPFGLDTGVNTEI